MMVNSKVTFYTVFISVLILSCASKVKQENINKPFKKDFEKYVKKSYQEFHDYPLSFEAYYSSQKFELDRATKIRNEVIDSLGLLSKSNWLLINQYGTNYSGSYEKTYIIVDEESFYFYSLPQLGEGVDLDKYEIIENDIKMLGSLKDYDVFEIYNMFQNKTLKGRVAEPSINPLLHYDIIFVKDKKMKTYQITSEDYIIRRWK